MNNTGKKLHDALSMACRALAILEEQAAGYTALTIPTRLVLELEEKRKEMVRLEAQVQAAAMGVPGAGLPHNLPRRGEFVGREAYKARVHEALRSRSYLVSIKGIGGVGKTSLALEVAYECLQAGAGTPLRPDVACFDGVIWASARDRDLTLDNVLDAVARTLDYPGIAQKPLGEKREGVVRLLRSGAYLLLVDSFETITDAAVAEFLQDLPEPSKSLVTTRERNLERAWTIPLKGLEKTEALTLIRVEGQRIGMQALEQAEDVVLLPLYQATGGVPLALKWAVGQIKQPGQSLDTVLAALHEARGNIFDHIFARSWEMLTPNAQTVLLAVPLFATSASREAIEAVSEVHHYDLDAALRQLVQMSLIDATDDLEMISRRFSMHPLTRFFAEAQLRFSPNVKRLMQQRLVGYFHAFARRYGGYWNEDGFAKIEAEFLNIMPVLGEDWSTDLINQVVDIFIDLNDFFVIRGYWNVTLNLGKRLIANAIDSGETFKAAQIRLWPISWVYRHQGHLGMAESEAMHALAVFESRHDLLCITHAKRHLGRIAQERGDLERAQVLLTEALAYFEQNNAQREIIMTVGNLGEIALEKGALNEAEALCLGKLDVARQLNDPERLSALLFILGRVAYEKSDFERARAYWEESLALMRKANRPDGVAGCLMALGQNEVAAGEIMTAASMLIEARQIYTRLDVADRIQEIDQVISSPAFASIDKVLLEKDIGIH